MKRPFIPRHYPRQHDVPQMWTIFIDWLGLEERLARKWWQSLDHSKWTEPVLLCQRTRIAPRLQLNRLVMIHETYQPGRLIMMTEDLVTQALLSRWEANKIEDAILRVTRTTKGCHKDEIPATLGRAIYGDYQSTPAQGWK